MMNFSGEGEFLMINYKHLLAFVTVVRKKSFTIAAKELFMTQPAISWQIKNLEGEIDLQLIERKERGTKLTEAGKQFYVYAEKIIKAHEQLIEEMKQLKCMEKGKLIVGASTVPGEYILPAYMSSFKDAYPATDVMVTTTSSDDVVENLISEDIHIGVVGMKVDDSRIESRPFKKDKVIMIVKDGHPLLKLDKVCIKDVLAYPIVVREKGSASRRVLEDKMETKGLKLKNFAYFTELSGNRSAITAVKNSNSVAFVSSLVAGDSLALGCVKAVEVDDFDLSRNIYLIHNKLKTLSPLSETFLNFMLKQKD